MVKSIVIAGVGGQGTLLASKILAAAAGAKGLFVRTSETIGMAQRGGSVSSHLRIEAKEVSPIIPTAHADILLGFEPAEAVRMLPKLTPEARCVVCTENIVPTNVALGKGVYLADEYINTIKKYYPTTVFIDGAALALKAGDLRTLNIILLGAASAAGALPFSEEEIRAAIKSCVRPKLFAMNEKAFALGLAAVSNRRWQ